MLVLACAVALLVSVWAAAQASKALTTAKEAKYRAELADLRYAVGRPDDPV